MEPKVLFAVDGYTYNGRRFDSRDAVAGIQAALPTLERTVVLPYLESQPDLSLLEWRNGCTLVGLRRPWRRPLVRAGTVRSPALRRIFIRYDRRMPKAIVHGHGGALLEHAKLLSLQMDIGEGDRFFWFSTTGWIMWNILMSGLLLGSSIVLYDGSPAHPDMYALWRVAERTRITSFGVSAPYILGCMKAEHRAGRLAGPGCDALHRLDGGAVAAGGVRVGVRARQERPAARLHQRRNGHLHRVRRGRARPCPSVPGEIQCRCLGCKVESFDDSGKPVVGEVGELVVTEPMPSMPVRFLNDPDGSNACTRATSTSTRTCGGTATG